MKNVIFMVNLPEDKKPGRNEPYEYSIKSWKHYADRHQCEVHILEKRIYPESDMNANWHKIFALELLEANGVDYNRVLIVDGDTIIHPDAPDIFEVAPSGFCAAHNDGSYDWMLRSYENYSKHIFSRNGFPIMNYFNSGVIVIGKEHRDFYREVLDFYLVNKHNLQLMQTQFGVGTDQPVMNFLVHLERDDFKLLPYAWNMQEMARREILDTNLTFTDYGWLYHFNGIPPDYKLSQDNGSAVYQWMKFTYQRLYIDGKK